MPAALLRVRLTPRSSDTRIARIEEGVVHARVTAPPVEGAANKALIELLAGSLGVPKSAVSIRSGASSREKQVAVEGIDAEEALARLRAKLSG